MSAWDKLNEWLNPPSPRGIWEKLERLVEEARTIKGFTPEQAGIMKQLGGAGVQTKQGISGTVVSMSPQDWVRVKGELESNREYYDWKLQGQMDDLLGKIRSEVGITPAAPSPDQRMTGKPSDVTPGTSSPQKFDVKGMEYQGLPGKTVQQVPQRRSDDERRRRVAAQDRAMMGGKTKPIGKVSVK